MKHIESLDILNSNNYSFVDVYANWCGPCKRIEPKIIELSKSHSSINFYKSNIDESSPFEDLVEVLPTFLIYKKDKLIKTIKGADLKSIQIELNKLVINEEVVKKEVVEKKEVVKKEVVKKEVVEKEVEKVNELFRIG